MIPTDTSGNGPAFPTARTLALLFLLAVLIRVGYALAGYAVMGAEALTGPDSLGFLGQAQFLADGGSAFGAEAGAVAGFDINNMPVGFYLMALTLPPGGVPDPLVYVLLQCAIDAATCLLIGWIAWQIAPAAALPAVLVAALNPTQIVMAGLFYTDTVFTFFVTAALALSLCWLRRRQLWVLAGAGLFWGLALMTRSFAQYWLLLLPLLLFASTVWLDRRVRLRPLAHIGLAWLCILAVALPVMNRNLDRFGTAALSAQSGAHLLYWVVPLVKEAKDGSPREKTNAENRRLYEAVPEADGMTPFDRSDAMASIAKQQLDQLGVPAIAGAWVKGAALNLAAPAVTIAPAADRHPRQGFYETPGSNTAEKIWNFLTQESGATYILLVLLAGLTMPFWIVLGIGGFAAALRTGRACLPAAVILFLWAGYTLGINGPVVSPKYRLPLEPVWAVFAAVALTAGWTYLQKRRRNRTSPALPLR